MAASSCCGREVLSRYAAAAVRKVRKHPQELGCIREDELLAADLDFQDFQRLPSEHEAVVLRTLLERFGQPGRAEDNSPAIYRWVSRRKGNESRQGRKSTRVLPHDFFRPCGAWARLGIGDPTVETVGYHRSSLRDWPFSRPAGARLLQPGRAKDNSPVIYRWVSRRKGNESR